MEADERISDSSGGKAPGSSRGTLESLRATVWATFLASVPIILAVGGVGTLVVFTVLPPIERVNERVNGISGTMTTLVGEVGAIKSEVENFTKRVEKIEARADKMEETVRELTKDIGVIQGRISSSPDEKQEPVLTVTPRSPQTSERPVRVAIPRE